MISEIKLHRPFIQPMCSWKLIKSTGHRFLDSYSLKDFKNNRNNCQERELRHGIYEISCNIKDVISHHDTSLTHISTNQGLVYLRTPLYDVLKAISEGYIKVTDTKALVYGYFIKRGEEIYFILVDKNVEDTYCC